MEVSKEKKKDKDDKEEEKDKDATTNTVATEVDAFNTDNYQFKFSLLNLSWL